MASFSVSALWLPWEGPGKWLLGAAFWRDALGLLPFWQVRRIFHRAGALGSAGVRDNGQVIMCAEASTDGGEERHGAREGGSRHI